MSWLTGGLVESGWLTGPMDVEDSTKKAIISSPNQIVDINGTPVTHTFDYWFITQDAIDTTIVSNTVIDVVDSGTDLEIVDGEGEVILTNATVGQTYRFVGFDVDESNYFRTNVVITEEPIE